MMMMMRRRRTRQHWWRWRWYDDHLAVRCKRGGGEFPSHIATLPLILEIIFSLFLSSSKLLFNNWSVIPQSYTFIHHDFFNPWQSALINMFRIVTRWEIKSIVPHCYKHSCLSSFDNFVIIHDLWFCIGLDTGWFILHPPHISTKKKTAKQAIIAAVPVNPVLFLTAWRFSFWYWNLGGS